MFLESHAKVIVLGSKSKFPEVELKDTFKIEVQQIIRFSWVLIYEEHRIFASCMEARALADETLHRRGLFIGRV